jgi:hypothetical protein
VDEWTGGGIAFDLEVTIAWALGLGKTGVL